MSDDLHLMPVFGTHHGCYIYGQVVATAGRTVSVRSPAGETTSLSSKVEEVAPVLCMLLHNAKLTTKGLTRTKLKKYHATILDRLLGDNGCSATRKIPELLEGLLPRHAPDTADRCSWVDPETEEEMAFSLGHAVDFAHFIDGDQPIPRSLRSRIGATFMEEPEPAPLPRPTPTRPPTRTDQAVSQSTIPASAEPNPALDALLSAFEQDAPANTSAHPGNPVQAELIAMIERKPHVLAFYMDQCLENSRKRPAPADRVEATRPAKQATISHGSQHTTVSDLIDLVGQQDRGRSKDAFRPNPEARAIHAAIVSPRHQGKPPTTYVDLTLSSPATEFEPYPSVLVRLFDMQFGLRGLTLRYLGRLDWKVIKRWKRSGNVNMSDYALSTKLPEPPQVTSLEKLRDNLSVFHAFALEFFNQATQDLIKAASDFATTLTRLAAWQPTDVEELVDWFDNIFEEYRRAVEVWVSTGEDNRAAVQKRFAKSDPDFLILLFNMRSAPATRQPPTETRDRPDSRKTKPEKRRSRIPDDVYAAAPRHNGKVVCLRFLSHDECPSTDQSRCTSANLVHMTPAVPIKPIVRRVSYAVVQHVHDILEKRLREAEAQRLERVNKELAGVGVPPPTRNTCADGPRFDLDHELQRALSELARRKKLSLVSLIQLCRDESDEDSRPNKALDPTRLSVLLQNYPHRDKILEVIRHGVKHPFPDDGPPSQAQPNHKSARLWLNALMRSLRKGQDDGSYLIVDLNTTREWANLHFSPYGCVPKAGADPRFEARVILDLSYPDGSSTNSSSDREDLPPVRLLHVRALAERIEELYKHNPAVVIKMMKGDVKGAFRHIPLASEIARWFLGAVPEHEAAVIDLALPFGWTGSPAWYGIFGGAISHLVSRESPASLCTASTDRESFFGYEWVDDHVMIEPDREDRLSHAESALRLAMLAVLGPRSINESKFSTWETRLTVLGLEWDTVERTVSMPEDKIAKALLRIQNVLRSGRATKHQLSKLLGSLRHVCSCIRPAKPFYQRVVALWRRASPFQSIDVNPAAMTDLRWFEHILAVGRLRSVPTSFFCQLPEPDVHLYMDASNSGLCVLHPAAGEYLRVQFDESELLLIQQCRTTTSDDSFSINVREQLSAVLALLVWGATWSANGKSRLVHVRCWVDNSSAVSWCNSLGSRNRLSQELNRIIGAIEAQFGIRVSAEHIPGSRNVLADLDNPRSDQESLQRQISTLQRRSLADTSQRTYDTSWRQWCEYRQSLGLSKWLPQDDRDEQSLQLVAFAIHAARYEHPNGPRPAYDTIRAKLSHIGWYHCVRFGRRPRLHDGHQLALRGLQRLQPSTERPQRAPITITILRALAAITNFAKPQHRVLFGAAVLGFFFLLRSAEYLAIDGKRHAYALEVRDVQTTDDTGRHTNTASTATSVTVRLRGGKSDQLGAGTIRSLKRSNEAPICPVFAALLLLTNASEIGLRDDSALCTLPSRKMVSTKLMNSALRLAAATTGTRGPVSTHSLRIGGATALFQGGADELTIKHHGRWRSNAFNRYTRLTEPHGRRLTVKFMGLQQHA